ncbi:hypothetical protein Tco_1447253 [Tanacetum coccineum]
MNASLKGYRMLRGIGERPAEITDDSKWDEMIGKLLANSICISRLRFVSSLSSMMLQPPFWKKKIAPTNREDMQTSSRTVGDFVVSRRESMEHGSSGSHNHGKSKTGKKKKNFKCLIVGKQVSLLGKFVEQRLQMKAGRDLQMYGCSIPELTFIMTQEERMGFIQYKNPITWWRICVLVAINNDLRIIGIGSFMVARKFYPSEGREIIEEAGRSVCFNSTSHRVAITWLRSLDIVEQENEDSCGLKLLPGITKMNNASYVIIRYTFNYCWRLNVHDEMCEAESALVNYSDFNIFGSLLKGYRLWDPTAHKVVVSRDVVFYERSKFKKIEEGDSTTKGKLLQVR